MKKIFALALAAMMLVGCMSAALADEVLVLKTEGSQNINSFVEEWAGEYKLVAYYVGEEFAEENEIETVGVVELESDAVLTVVSNYDGSATGSPDGPIVDQAAYTHAHVYDMEGTLAYGDEEVALQCKWDGWNYSVIGEGQVDFASSIGKMSKAVKGDVFMEITGLDNDAFDEKLNYIGMTEDGCMVIAYSESNLVKKGNDEEIGFALVFAPVVEE